MDYFLIIPLLFALILSLVTGPLGCFIIWRRMAYFGDTLAHASLMGISISLTLSFPIKLGILCTGILIALLIMQLKENRYFAMDTILGLIAHGGLAFGMIIFYLFQPSQLSLFSYLFGDILSVNSNDIIYALIGFLAIAIFFYFSWQKLIFMTIHKDLATSEKVPTKKLDYLFLIMLTILITLSIQSVGVLLITSMLIIPAATARIYSKTPLQMAILASCIGGISSCLGFWLSLNYDTPTGPSIIVSALSLFFLSNFIVKLLYKPV